MQHLSSNENSLREISLAVMKGLKLILQTTARVLTRDQHRALSLLLKDISLWVKALEPEDNQIILSQNYRRLVDDARQFLNRARFGAKENVETSEDLTIYLTLLFKIFNLLSMDDLDNKDLNYDARTLATYIKKLSGSFMKMAKVARNKQARLSYAAEIDFRVKEKRRLMVERKRRKLEEAQKASNAAQHRHSKLSNY